MEKIISTKKIIVFEKDGGIRGADSVSDERQGGRPLQRKGGDAGTLAWVAGK